MQKLVSDYSETNQCVYLGSIHTQFDRYVNEPCDWTSLNSDGQLRSVFFGRSDEY